MQVSCFLEKLSQSCSGKQIDTLLSSETIDFRLTVAVRYLLSSLCCLCTEIRVKAEGGSSAWEWEERNFHFISAHVTLVVCIRVDHLSERLQYRSVSQQPTGYHRLFLSILQFSPPKSSNLHMYNRGGSMKGQRARPARVKVGNGASDFNDEGLRWP